MFLAGKGCAKSLLYKVRNKGRRLVISFYVFGMAVHCFTKDAVLQNLKTHFWAVFEVSSQE